MRFKSKTVLITGAAGGVGQTLVKLFAMEGANVMMADRDDDACQTVAQQVVEASGCAADKIAFYTGDLTQREYCDALVEHTVATFGQLDVLCNNAGIIPRGTIEETTDDMWFSAMNVNLNAVFFLCRAAVPHMKEKGGAIVNTSSVWGTQPGPGHVAYCTSKGAVAALTQNLGRDCAPFGIRVNAVCPHEINTPMIRSGFSRRGLDPDKAVQELNKTVPLGRIAEPEDISDVIAFLASDAARYIAGTTIDVTGAKPVSG